MLHYRSVLILEETLLVTEQNFIRGPSEFVLQKCYTQNQKSKQYELNTCDYKVYGRTRYSLNFRGFTLDVKEIFYELCTRSKMAMFLCHKIYVTSNIIGLSHKFYQSKFILHFTLPVKVIRSYGKKKVRQEFANQNKDR